MTTTDVTYLQPEQLRAERDRLAAEARDILDRNAGGLSGEDQTRFEAIESQLGEMQTRERNLTRIAELAQNPHAVERVDNSLAGMGTSTTTVAASTPPPDPTAIPGLLPSAPVLSALHAATTQGRSIRSDAHVLDRAAVLTTDTGADELAQQLTLRPREPRRIVTAAGMQSQSVAGVTSVNYPVFGSGAAGITSEGDTKTEYDAITPGSATPQVISVWTDYSRQTSWTMSTFEQKLRGVLAAKIARREDQLVTSTVLATTGILTLDGTPSPDTLLEAAALVTAGEVAAEPNLVLINPADIATVLGSDVGAGGSASPEFSSFAPRVNGMRIYLTSAIDEGEALVGAWAAAGSFVVGQAPMFLTDAASQIKNNLVTLLGEEAVNIAVDEPEGFCHVRADDA